MAQFCPKCENDITESFQEADPSVGIMGSGYYCDACDTPVESGDYEPMEGDVPIPPAPQTLGTPLSELSGQPGKPGYEEFKRIAKSWGHE